MMMNNSKRIADLAMSMPMPSDSPPSEGLALGPEEPDMGGGDPVSDMKSLLDTWTERDPSTTAGQYYQDLKLVVDKYARD